MKAFAAALLALGSAQSSYNEDGSIWMTSEAEAVTVTVQPEGASTVVNWTINTYGETNLDTLERFVVIEHVLNTNVFSDDTIMFEVAFTPTNTALVAAQTDLMTKDVARCTTNLNTMDPDYWNQSVTDAYYLTAADADGNPVTTYYTDSGTAQDWEVWNEDNDSNVNSPYCTFDATFAGTAEYLSIFKCTTVRCTMRRKLDTTDNTDAWFSLENADTDTIAVAIGDAFIQFNQ